MSTAYTVKEAAAAARVSPAFLYRSWSNGAGPVRTRIGGKVLVLRSDLEDWLNNHREERAGK